MLPKDIVRGVPVSRKGSPVKAEASPGRDDETDSDLYNDKRSLYEFEKDMSTYTESNDTVSGEFLELAGERFYAIHNADKMAPFFISVISDSDHWLFASSTGGLTAGRVSPETALFPYVTVDKIHDNAVHTGCKTILHVNVNGSHYEWEPFNMEHDGLYLVNRHLYKNLLGNKLCFEEINHDLQLVFRYTWATSDSCLPFGWTMYHLRMMGKPSTSSSATGPSGPSRARAWSLMKSAPTSRGMTSAR